MPFDPNDPRLTALALGELPEDERLAIEAEIADDPEAVAALAEIAATAQLLTEQFRLETELSAPAGLDAAQKRAIEDCLAAGTVAGVEAAAPPATVPFAPVRPSAPEKPSASPAPVPPSRSVFHLRVAAGIVAIGTVAAGVAVLKFGVIDRDPPLAMAVSPSPATTAPAAPAAPPLASRLDMLGAPAPATEAEGVVRRNLTEPVPAPVAQDFAGRRGGGAPPSDPGVMGGGGGGMMMGTMPSNAPALPPRPRSLATPAPSRLGESPAGGPQAGMMGNMGGSTRGSMGQGQGVGGEAGQSQAFSLSGGTRGLQGQQGKLGMQGQGQGQQGQGQGLGGMPGQFGRGQKPAGGNPQPGEGGATLGGLTSPSAPLAAKAKSARAASAAPEPLADKVGHHNARDLQNPADKPGLPPLGTSEEKAAKGNATAATGPAKAEDPSARNEADASKLDQVYNYQRVETLAKQLKDVPATAPVEVKLKADRLQRESQLMLERFKLAEAKPDQNIRDFDAKKQDVYRFGKELQEVAQQVEEARKAPANDEEFGKVQDNPFQIVNAAPLSTFSVDVDTASYANVRRFLNQNSLPPKDAVRIEELINYFTYDDPAPMANAKEPFSLNVESAACPWSDKNRLVRVGLKGKAVADDKRPASNLVFLVDVSGSMADLDKLPLLKAAMKLLVDNLTENDRVAIVTYANGVRVALPSTPCHRKPEILSVLEGLEAGGGTNGAGGIQRAYDIAIQNFIKGGTNRVLLATDGDFNVGVSDTNELVTMIQEKAKSGVFLSVLGFGQGNLKDEKMEQLADKGNGQYSYIDSIAEARKVLVKQMGGTIVTIAKDVKVQVEFNPSKVAAYRLIGYENRMLQAQDFRDDKKDAGEIGAGLSVTALYEIVPAGADANAANNVNLRFQNVQNRGVGSPEWLHVAIRYKAPDGDVSTEFGKDLVDDGRPFARASNDLKFASAVAGFGMLLRDSPYKGRLTWPAVEELTLSGMGNDSGGYRHEFQGLVKKAASLARPAGQ